MFQSSIPIHLLKFQELYDHVEVDEHQNFTVNAKNYCKRRRNID